MSIDFTLLDRVALRAAQPQYRFDAGTRGTIVHIHTNPNLAFEVEFCDEDGRTTARIARLPTEVELIRST
ncbi:DUF4926 domain-containing protein [Paraburkholderia hospita]|nr:protein of unknown function [Paraburkholderia hospita]